MAERKTYRLAPRELEIMNVVWDCGEVTVRDVCDRLQRPAAYTTVLTIMRILETKGVLAHRVRGRTYVYRARVPRSSVQNSMLLELRDALFSGSTPLLINTIVTESNMSDEEINELRQMLDSLAQTEGTTGHSASDTDRLG